MLHVCELVYARLRVLGMMKPLKTWKSGFLQMDAVESILLPESVSQPIRDLADPKPAIEALVPLIWLVRVH